MIISTLLLLCLTSWSELKTGELGGKRICIHLGRPDMNSSGEVHLVLNI
jgi:hypothetical protein